MRKTRPQDATTLVRGSGIGRTAQPEHSEGEEEKARERRRSSKTCVDMVRLLGGDDTRGMDPEAEELHAADGRNADEARAPPAADADADAGDVDADTDASERAAGERQSRLKRVQWHSAGNGWLEQGSALARLLHVIICGEDDEGGQDSEITEASGGGGGGGSDGRGGGVGGDGDGDDTEAGRATVGHPPLAPKSDWAQSGRWIAAAPSDRGDGTAGTRGRVAARTERSRQQSRRAADNSDVHTGAARTE